ncbi:hypothetical protein CCHR01_00563 [Colletotrichum chrysophilum]|uniref:Uncharacterized protein n=1 Tax=Colletotrichum chrysophilum TaxID=1836956 RepID=A0AAD9EQ01_9PEZI|nr:hypothetical protein CCHR01_00563 [Colletotrichum chrysophilum]
MMARSTLLGRESLIWLCTPELMNTQSSSGNFRQTLTSLVRRSNPLQ